METVKVVRLQSSNMGMFGRLYGPGGLVLFTGELDWHDNQSDISCVPPNPPPIYRCEMTYSPHFMKKTYEIFGVKGRFSIRMHSATFMGDAPLRKQLNGCMALGEKLGWMDGQRAVLVSRPAISKFEMVMERKPFLLEIQDGRI